jgi:thiamine-phosphate diphosphorylase/hydroxyethylthiazole kinase
MLLATVAGTLALTIAAQQAASREDVRGPGTFLPALIDELAVLTPEMVLRMAKIEVETVNDGQSDGQPRVGGKT